MSIGSAAKYRGPTGLSFHSLVMQLNCVVAAARASDRAGFARSELAMAEQNIAAARQAARVEDYLEANRRLREAFADVELATVRAEEAGVKAELQRRTERPAPARTAKQR